MATNTKKTDKLPTFAATKEVILNSLEENGWIIIALYYNLNDGSPLY